MKKRIVWFIAAILLLCGMLNACGQKAENTDSNNGVSLVNSEEQSREEENSPDKKDNETGGEAEGGGNAESTGGMEKNNTDAVEESGRSTEEAQNEKGSVSEGSGFPVAITDMLEHKVTLEKKPEKVAVISRALLELFYSVGGKSVCKVEMGKDSPVYSTVESLPQVGRQENPDIIGILDLQPDLVIAEAGLQNEAAAVLQQSGMIVISLQTDTADMKKRSVEIMEKVIEKGKSVKS